MVFGSRFALILVALVELSQAASSPPVGSVVRSPPTSVRVATVLAPGQSFVSGSINANIVWQSSGVLNAGGCLQPDGNLIRSCYSMSLTAQGQLEETVAVARRSVLDLTLEEAARRNPEDLHAYFAAFPEEREVGAAGTIEKRATTPTTLKSTKPAVLSSPFSTSSLSSASSLMTTKPMIASKAVVSSSSAALSAAPGAGRQRIEIYSWPGALANEKWTYTWKSYARPSAFSSVHFSHAWQMLRRDKTGGPVVTLDYKVDKVVIDDIVAGCTGCAVAPLSSWLGIVVIHQLSVTWGMSGTMAYSAANVKFPTVPLISYSATHDMGSSASIKFGMYRLVVPEAKAYKGVVGDYVATRLA